MASQQIDKLFPKRHKYKYEERLVAYIDILGWKNLTKNENIDSRSIKVLEYLDEVFAHFNNEFVESLKKSEKIKNINPLIDHINVGFFSDAFLLSMPAKYGERIFTVARHCRKIMSLGCLSRGAITKGLCYHHGDRAFGPAINEVVDLEKKSTFPRIICSDKIIADYKKAFYSTDLFGCKVLNIFNDVNLEKNDEITKIEKQIKKNIKLFKSCDKRILEKWMYAEILMKNQLKPKI